MKIYSSNSNKTTKEIALNLAEKLMSAPVNKKRALVIALIGDLGAGKTTFVQGFLKGAGIKKKTTSPTFVIMKKFSLKQPRKGKEELSFKHVYHLDCYRINSEELLDLNFLDILADPQNIVLVEWPEKVKKALPKQMLRISFKYGKKENERKITIH